MTSAKMAWKKWTILVSLLTGTGLVCIPAVGQNKPGAPSVQTQSVLVVNGAGQPVPTAAQGTTNVAGTVSIGNAPSVNVANTPTVNLAAGGSVNVTNPPNGQNNPTPVAVLEATQPYEDSCQFQFSGQNEGQCSFRGVPAGKRLVIQEFDALGAIEQGLKPLAIWLEPAGGQVPHYFPATFMGSSADDFFITHQETRLYVGSNQTLICQVALSGNSRGIYECQFSGFLVDVP